MDCRRALLCVAAGRLLQGGHAAPHEPVCPGAFSVQGIGNVSLIPTGWGTDEGPAKTVLRHGQKMTINMGARAYFASRCTAGVYNNEEYLALDLRGKTLKYTVDMSGAGCGCNAAFYLTNMRQNPHPSDCNDYYCDANNVCGESCAEIDMMEGNLYSWHSTLHGAQDHTGLGLGYGGGGAQWSGPRDWSGADFGPNGRCVDTKLPFEVAVSFPTNNQGGLLSMGVTLSQKGKACPLSINIGNYAGMAELDAALAKGMTPIVSYWNSPDMLWMDGKGSDGQGPCFTDLPNDCAESVTMSDFSVTPAFPPTTPNPEDTTTTQKPSNSNSSWGWCLVGAFMGGVATIIGVQALIILALWAQRRYRSQNGAPFPRISSLLSVASAQNLMSLVEGGGSSSGAGGAPKTTSQAAEA